MSFNRLRRLAGLNETIADDAGTNLEIERRLDALPNDLRGPVLDALELLKDAGPGGLMLQAWADQVRQLHAVESAGKLLKTVVTSFPNVIAKLARGHYCWRVVRAAEDEVIDPELHAAMGHQVALTSRAFALMRQQPRFTADWLASALSRNSDGAADAPALTPPLAHAFVEHLLSHFAGMLTQQGNTYSLKTEAPQTRDDTMAGLRDLASKKPDDSVG